MTPEMVYRGGQSLPRFALIADEDGRAPNGRNAPKTNLPR